MIASLIDNGCSGMNDIAYRSAPPVGGLPWYLCPNPTLLYVIVLQVQMTVLCVTGAVDRWSVGSQMIVHGRNMLDGSHIVAYYDSRPCGLLMRSVRVFSCNFFPRCSEYATAVCQRFENYLIGLRIEQTFHSIGNFFHNVWILLLTRFLDFINSRAKIMLRKSCCTRRWSPLCQICTFTAYCSYCF